MSDPNRLKRALDELIYLPSLRGEGPERARGAVAALSPATATPTQLRTQEGPNPVQCRPWDRGDLLRRLQTFRASTWFCKPSLLGPVPCASRGWTNVDRDTLQCEFCAAKLVINIPIPSRTEEQKQLVERHVRRLDESHTSFCPWRGNACSPWLLQFPTQSRDALLEQYESRRQAFAAVDGLPEVKPSCLELMMASKKGALDKMLGGSGALQIGRSKAQRRAIVQQLLALCGWEVQTKSYTVSGGAAQPSPRRSAGSTSAGVVDSQGAVLCCPMCAARIGLWNFKAPEALLRPLWQTNFIHGKTSGPQGSPSFASPEGRGSGAPVATTPLSARQPGPPSATASTPRPRSAGPAVDVQRSLGRSIAGGDLDMLAEGVAKTPGGVAPVSSAARLVKLVASTPSAPVFGSSARQSSPVFGLQSFGSPPAVTITQQPPATPTPAAPPSTPIQTQSANQVQGTPWESPDPQVAGKKRRIESPANAAACEMDILGLHRPFCPWVSTSSGEAKGLKCGWMHVLDALGSGTSQEAEVDTAEDESAPSGAQAFDMCRKRFMSALYGA